MAAGLILRTGTAAVAAAGLLAGGGVAAAAPVRAGLGTASAPGWRVVATGNIPHRESIMVSANAPAGDDAWALGFSLNTSNPDLADSALVIEHWAGRRWQPVVLPAAVAKKFRVFDPFEAAIRAAGSAGAWIFGSNWLRWDGKQWHAGSLPVPGHGQQPNVNSATVFGPANVWVFGGVLHKKLRGYAAHYNGRRWSEVAVPGSREITGVSTLRRTDFWAVTGQPVIDFGGQSIPAGGSVLHWSGNRWAALKLPATLAKRAFLTSVLARSDRDVWVGGALRVHASSGGFVPRSMVAHWNGRAWSVTELAGSAKNYLTLSLAEDGAGGIWATGACLACSSFAPQSMWHWQHGQWTGPPRNSFGPVRANILQLAQVGRSSSVWAVGVLFNKSQWLIGLHGKMPH